MMHHFQKATDSDKNRMYFDDCLSQCGIAMDELICNPHIRISKTTRQVYGFSFLPKDVMEQRLHDEFYGPKRAADRKK
jgi:hypothetical protein